MSVRERVGARGQKERVSEGGRRIEEKERAEAPAWEGRLEEDPHTTSLEKPSS